MPNPKPLGRPPLGKTKRADAVLVKINPDERKRLEQLARKSRLPLAVYLRRAGLQDL